LRDPKKNAADRYRYGNRDLEKLEPYGERLRVLKFGILKRDSPKFDYEQIRNRRQPEPKLIGPECVARRAVSKEVNLKKLQSEIFGWRRAMKLSKSRRLETATCSVESPT
jgi:hypothetical protein